MCCVALVLRFVLYLEKVVLFQRQHSPKSLNIFEILSYFLSLASILFLFLDKD